MKKEQTELINPMEQVNSALDECSNTLVNSLALIGVNKVSGQRTISCGGNVYEIVIDAKILKV